VNTISKRRRGTQAQNWHQESGKRTVRGKHRRKKTRGEKLKKFIKRKPTGITKKGNEQLESTHRTKVEGV